MNNKFLGTYGEVLAKNHLIGLGYKIIAENEKNFGGEMDIVAVDRDGTLVFVEVKARKNEKFGHPIEAVTIAKAKRYISASKIFLAKNKWLDKCVRYDVVTVLGDELQHIIDAFDASVLRYR